MSKNIKLFLIFFVLSIFFWWGTDITQKNVEDFFYMQEMKKNPPLLFSANITRNLFEKSEKLEIKGESAISVKIDKNGNENILFKKLENQKMPIASLTKLMTSITASEFYDPDIKFRISKQAVKQEEETGSLKVGEILTLNELLKIALIESSNDAAFAIGDLIGEKGFVDLMNMQIQDMGIKNTYFFNSTGLDPEDENESPNISTTEDLVKIVKHLLKKPDILDILSKKSYDLYLENGEFHHTLINTNILIEEIPMIIGGKTGYTEKAGGCLILILRGKSPETYLINVILNSPNKFQDMERLIEYTYTH